MGPNMEPDGPPSQDTPNEVNTASAQPLAAPVPAVAADPLAPAAPVFQDAPLPEAQPTARRPWLKILIVFGIAILVGGGVYVGIRIFAHPKFKTITYNNRYDTIAQLQFYAKYFESDEPSGSQYLISKEPAIGYAPLELNIEHTVTPAYQLELANCNLPQTQAIDTSKTLFVKNRSTGSLVKLCATSSATYYQSSAINGYEGLLKFEGVNYHIEFSYYITAQQNASRQTTDIQVYKDDIATIVSSLKILSHTSPN